MAWLTSPAGAFAKAGEDMQDGLGRKSHLLIATKSVTDLRAARRRLARCWSLRTDFLAGKLRPRSVDSRYRGVTRRRSRFVFFHFLGFGILRQHGRRQKGGDRTNEQCVCNPHVRFSFAKRDIFHKEKCGDFCDAIGTRRAPVTQTVIPRACGYPVGRGLSVLLRLRWNIGSAAFAGDDDRGYGTNFQTAKRAAPYESPRPALQAV
jgi:hypothetical protein